MTHLHINHQDIWHACCCMSCTQTPTEIASSRIVFGQHNNLSDRVCKSSFVKTLVLSWHNKLQLTASTSAVVTQLRKYTYEGYFCQMQKY